VSAAERNLAVHVASGDALDVRWFHVDQRMSALFECTVVALSESPNIDFDAVVGQPASFHVEKGNRASWTGICSHLEQVAVEERGLSTYRVTVVPSLWLATQRRNHRMFQYQSELEIACKLLGEWGVAPELRITGVYKKRKYRVQYGETDFAFLCRMLEEAGISFYFDVSGASSVLVLTDAPQANAPREPAIAFRDRPTVADREHVTKVRVGQQVKPGRCAVRDHDPRLPAAYPLVAAAEAPGAGVEGRLERFVYAPGAFQFVTDQGEPNPAADDRGRARTDEKEAGALAQKRLEADRAGARVVSFETNAVDPAPGTVLGVLDHPRVDLGPGKTLLIVASTHEGTVDGEWSHRCDAHRADAPHRPPLVTPKPKVSGVESATVVGPSGQEIHTDEHGRVRVHFHWDRESAMDNRSSCWIPVSQSWSGAGYGGTNLPRVGQEVLVDFLGGDPDRPVVTGRVYTGQQKTPYKLPENKTQSGWKSCSTNGTGGYNEVMFEDASGRELLRMQAERDLKKLVKNDEDVTIGHDRTKLVKNDDTFTVGHDRTKLVQNDEKVTIGKDRTKLVQNDEQVTIGHDRTKLVQNDEKVTIGHDRTKVVQNDEQVTIGKNRTKNVQNNESVTIGKSRTKMVRKNETVAIGQDYTRKVKSNQKVSIGKNLMQTVLANAREVTGMNRNVSVGMSRATQVGMIDSTIVGQTHTVMVMPAGEQGPGMGVTSTTMSATTITSTTPGGAKIILGVNSITLDTGMGASMQLAGDGIILQARNLTVNMEGRITVDAMEDMVLSAKKGVSLLSDEGKIECFAGTDVVMLADGKMIQIQCTSGDTLINGKLVKINC
jgi:type VI secretion system secreted protein VgrG